MSDFIIDFALQLTHDLDKELGVPNKTTISQRDVPGFTRAAIPLFNQRGIDTFSLGINGGSGPANVPPAFTWHDAASDTHLNMLVHYAGYGGFRHPPLFPDFVPIIIPGSQHAFIVDWRGDNAGPPTSPQELIDDFAQIQSQFPGATIVPSTFDEFAAHVRQVPAANLPQYYGEIGDSWMYGVASDPQKVARVRAARRVLQNTFPATSQGRTALWNATRLFLKNGEHTWGLDQKSTITPLEALHSNWSNAEFHAIVRDAWLPSPPALSQMYTKLAASWTRQRYVGLGAVVEALELGDDTTVAAAAAIREAWEGQSPAVPDTTGYASLPLDTVGRFTFATSDWEVQFSNTTGAMVWLKDTVNAVQWLGGCGNPGDARNGHFGLLEYRSYNADNETEYEDDYNFAWIFYDIDDGDDQAKLGIDAYNATYRVVHPQLQQFFFRKTAMADGRSSMSFLLQVNFSMEAVQLAGAPADAWLHVNVTDAAAGGGGRALVNITVAAFNKTATRLPEAFFLRFIPRACAYSGGTPPFPCLSKLGSWVDPWPVPVGGATHIHGIDDRGFYYTTASSNTSTCAAHADATLSIVPWDASLINIGTPTAYPSPLEGLPDTTEGIASLLYNNIWNTNYIMWW
ncbi:unnamed protein product, partial [Symbiodinium sp. KB8]